MTIRGEVRVEAGHLILVDFSPARGTERDGKRPALVLSEAGMHQITRCAIVCPITRNTNPWPTKVFLPNGLATEGAILVDQVRSIDRGERILCASWGGYLRAS